MSLLGCMCGGLMSSWVFVSACGTRVGVAYTYEKPRTYGFTQPIAVRIEGVLNAYLSSMSV
jgi:hypothetical protein